MSEVEFDKFAKKYKEMHRGVIGASGEDTGFFAEYKVKDTANCIRECGFQEQVSILDFGSGIGESVPYFLKYLPQSQLTCLDVSRKSLNVAKDKFGSKAIFVHFNGSHIPIEDDSFHVVFTACVFHHIPQEFHLGLIGEIGRVLKPGGMFIVFEHNPYNFLTVKAVNSCPFDESAVLIHGNKFRMLLEKGGFVDRKLCYRIFFPGSLRFLRPLEKYMTWIPFGAQYYVRAQKSR